MADIEKILEELKERTVIVEGKKDVRSLKELGIDSIPINRRPLIDVVQGLEKEKEVVILTDFDREGKRLCAKLLTLLQSRRIKTSRRLRNMIRGFGKTRIEDFKGIESFEKAARQYKKEGDNYGETSANINKVHSKRKDKSKGSYREA
ncbi:MAG: toprim domain-containing protein [Candidatus Aenigmarchaeota archaeon]|nr:toprim domain-containing protein [Candidatus Aenigmarchaeota archaeon]